jgi:KUP system potassium uptake protein
MMQDGTEGHTRRGGLAALSVAALGIVFGAIGTSPLYALDQLLFHAGVTEAPRDVTGVLSLVVWTITLIVAVKYALLVLRAENDGEGGVFALYGLVHPYKRRGAKVVLWALMLGAGLLFGDGMLTPAISVLAAMEGLEVAAPAMAGWVVPGTIALLTLVFAFQWRGTAGIGAVFGPITMVWFVVIAGLGAMQISQHPEILAALDPRQGIAFLVRSGGWQMVLALGALILVVSGSEAMYADLGHFGARPIRVAWFALVYPALLLNYLGQGAFVLGGGVVVGDNLFFSIVPEGMGLAMVALATVVTVIASQALISGVFTLTVQAIRLGLFPRLLIRHTHQAHVGQVYVPVVNAAMYVGCVLLVFMFGSSHALGPAYGLTVAGVMAVTTLGMVPVARWNWGWWRAAIIVVWGGFALIALLFLLATLLDVRSGGWVPLVIAVGGLVVMLTWQWGRKATFAAYSARPAMTMEELVRMHRDGHRFIERNAVLMAPKPIRASGDRAPALMRLLWERYGLLPRNLLFVEVTHRKTAYIHEARCEVTVFARDPVLGSVVSVEVKFGYMEEPNVERVLEEMARHAEIDLPTDRRQWIVHVSHENLLPSRGMGGLGRFRLGLFGLLRRISQPAYYYYGLGDEVQLSAEIMPVRVR